FRLFRRERMDGAEKLLVDTAELTRATGKPHAIGPYAPSADGRKLAYTVSAGGGEIGSIHVIDVETLEELTAPIDRVRSTPITWLDDASGFFYGRLAEGYQARPRAERYLDNTVWLRRLDAPAKDLRVFGPGLHPEAAIERSAAAAVFLVPGKPVVLAYVYHGVDPNRSLYSADLAGVLAGKARWRKLFDQGDRVNAAAVVGDFLYVKTSKGAPRFQVLRTTLAAPDYARAEVVFAPGEQVVVGLAGARDALYVTRRDGAVKRLWRVAHARGAKPEPVGLPLEGNVAVADARARLDGAILAIGGWTRASRYYALEAGAPRPKPLSLVPPGKYDAPPGLTAREVKVRSHDGVEVPVSIITRADIRLDGDNPALLYGYGAYGIVNEPSWSPRLLAWIERGGVLAIAHVRGGGIHGDEWRRAGWKATKPNTWKDGIAAAEWLVDNGYTTRGRLGIYGGSAGGIFVGRAITERPDLFAAAAILVGNTDSVRSETRANGVGNIPEYGTVTREDEFHALLAMSPYANVRPGTPYPSILFEHGVNDSRVDVWMTLKTGARFAAATSSGKPVLMRLEYDAGHGPGATRDQAQRRVADRYSYFLWQFGAPQFQPPP
ncbi:MAG TPA: prolyl oligopeptidase family serine peptidase, partial [Myxococcota bacterium]|nr:prolyl oligopeptidase family serine peptidase [Myxococcota bacterium]